MGGRPPTAPRGAEHASSLRWRSVPVHPPRCARPAARLAARGRARAGHPLGFPPLFGCRPPGVPAAWGWSPPGVARRSRAGVLLGGCGELLGEPWVSRPARGWSHLGVARRSCAGCCSAVVWSCWGSRVVPACAEVVVPGGWSPFACGCRSVVVCICLGEPGFPLGWSPFVGCPCWLCFASGVLRGGGGAFFCAGRAGGLLGGSLFCVAFGVWIAGFSCLAGAFPVFSGGARSRRRVSGGAVTGLFWGGWERRRSGVVRGGTGACSGAFQAGGAALRRSAPAGSARVRRGSPLVPSRMRVCRWLMGAQVGRGLFLGDRETSLLALVAVVRFEVPYCWEWRTGRSRWGG